MMELELEQTLLPEFEARHSALFFTMPLPDERDAHLQTLLDLTQIPTNQLPRVVSQAIPPGTKVTAGTVVGGIVVAAAVAGDVSGVVSTAVLLAADVDGKAIILSPDESAPIGSRVR